MDANVVVRDNGARKLLERAQDMARGRSVRVGILTDAPKDEKGSEKPTSMTLVEVAAIHEFGAPEAGIPQRSFLRSTVDENEARIGKLQEALGAKVLKGTLTEEQALNQVGAAVAGMVQAKIASNIPPALAPETIARKGSSVALVNTGQLRSSITWQVE